MIFGRATQVVLGAILRAHVSPDSSQNPPSVEIPEASSQPAPPSVTQDAAPSPPGIKDLPAGAAERYQDVLTLPLAGMFTGRVGLPKTIEGGEKTDAEPYKGGPSGKGTPDQKPVPMKKTKERTSKSS